MTIPIQLPIPYDNSSDIASIAPERFQIPSDRSPRGYASQEAFDAYMQEAPPTPTPIVEPTEYFASQGQNAIIDQMALEGSKIRPLVLGANLSLDGFEQRQAHIRDQILAKVNINPQMEIGIAAQKKMELQMSQLQDQLKSLGVLAGTPSSAQPVALNTSGQSLTKPFSMFFGFITNGEKQLYGLEKELSAFGKDNGAHFTPADMLRVQLKLSHVSQQLELFTSMLNKGLESSKTVLNTQI